MIALKQAELKLLAQEPLKTQEEMVKKAVKKKKKGKKKVKV